ncbi:MAG: peptide deformylase [Pseudomonadales bacterium]|nr:peptide deformylase [Pseudomonadales bacterium]
MSILEILEFPDPRLRTKAKPIKNIDSKITKLADDMLETMYNAPGIGLAATQINVHKRLIVIDISENKDQPLVFINPEISNRTGSEESEEGCLSVPEYYETVTRAETIRIKALNKEGDSFEMDCDGLLAVCLQHEVDHLNGKLFVDYLSNIKRQRIRKKLEKQHRQRS